MTDGNWIGALILFLVPGLFLVVVLFLRFDSLPRGIRFLPDGAIEIEDASGQVDCVGDCGVDYMLWRPRVAYWRQRKAWAVPLVAYRVKKSEVKAWIDGQMSEAEKVEAEAETKAD